MKDFYKERYEIHGETCLSLGWGSKCSQEKRFKVLKDVGINTGDTVLDIGAGFSDFYPYLMDNNITPKEYVGLEKEESFYKKSLTKFSKFENFTALNEAHETISDDRKYDWVVASGVFCFKSQSVGEIQEAIINIWKVANRGMAINFLSDYTPGIKKENFRHIDPVKMIEIFRKNITIRMSMRHDYLDNDFTIYAYKESG